MSQNEMVFMFLLGCAFALVCGILLGLVFGTAISPVSPSPKPKPMPPLAMPKYKTTVISAPPGWAFYTTNGSVRWVQTITTNTPPPDDGCAGAGVKR